MGDPGAIDNLPGMTPEDREDVVAAARRGLAEYKKTGDLTWLVGLKGAGAEPQAVDAAIAIGAQLAKQGFVAKAFDYFVGLQQLEPINYRVYQWLGYLLQLQKNHVMAYNMFLIGSEMNPKDPVLRLSLGESMLMIDESPNNGARQISIGIELAAGQAQYAAYVKRGEQLLAAVKQREADNG